MAPNSTGDVFIKLGVTAAVATAAVTTAGLIGMMVLTSLPEETKEDKELQREPSLSASERTYEAESMRRAPWADPYTKTCLQYNRLQRMSHYELRVYAIDKEGKSLHTNATLQSHVDELISKIYDYKPSDYLNKGELEKKAHTFWEVLAQELAQLYFCLAQPPQMPLASANSQRSTDDLVALIKSTKRLVIETTVLGCMDTFTPTDRVITMDFDLSAAKNDRDFQHALVRPNITVSFSLAAGLHVQSKHQEVLDTRPVIGGARDLYQKWSVVAHCSRAVRLDKTDYVDYQVLHVPLRHLLFQGSVQKPKRGDLETENLRYKDLGQLVERFEALVCHLADAPSGSGYVAHAVRDGNFFSKHYYYMVEDHNVKVSEYGDYLYDSIKAGIKGDKKLDRVELVVDNIVIGRVDI